ncbi:uncharacterized protein At4g04980-like isoform X2 [Zingiber officinale]|uniref:uncharacterized protein At4g04980-like isoform X2 n=1 Tax=Zingiber officinale TaxID=94328 RepID=UPI001C4B9429|nr:uncharacterized protein At4g04980-like isoform X2 [Zingiber officinale]
MILDMEARVLKMTHFYQRHRILRRRLPKHERHHLSHQLMILRKRRMRLMVAALILNLLSWCRPLLPILRLKAQPSSRTPMSPSSPMVLAGIPVFLGSPKYSTMEAEPIAYAVTIDQSNHVSKPSEASLPDSVSCVPKAQTLVPQATPVQSQEPKTPRPPALSGVFSTPSLLSKSDSPSSPPWPSQSCVAPSSPCPPPPPPSPVASSGQQSSLTSSNGFAPPPPPPLAATKAIRAKRNDARLKRSTPMGKLYRALKGKVEGSSLDGKALQVRKNQVGNSSGGNKAQGMADALAEMTKRSSYFRQIEEDVEKHSASILKMISSLNSFKTKDMKELSKFHQKIEQVLEKLTDETQVLSRFEGFPLKKLETIQVAAALHMRLESIVAALKGWKLASPIAQQLAKIKEEVDVTERNKDEESKRLKNHNIMFDFTALVRIKEAMVDLSSDCMEMVLKECRETQEIAGETTSKSKTRLKMLWRAFQLAFRVYNFAGGQDDRADKLTRELAREIEACSES